MNHITRNLRHRIAWCRAATFFGHRYVQDTRNAQSADDACDRTLWRCITTEHGGGEYWLSLDDL
jgi:hypothetical protein